MKIKMLAGRDCFINDCDRPQKCVVVLHARDMSALEMFYCVQAKRFGPILVIFPPSLQVDRWDWNPGSPDFTYLDALRPAIEVAFPSVESCSIAGFSSGGFMVSALTLFGSGTWDQRWQVCATVPRSFLPAIAWQVDEKVSLLLGQQDPIVPPAGDSEFLSADDAAALYESLGMQCSRQDFAGGHAWPGGVAPSPWVQSKLGPWPSTPDATQLIIDSLSVAPA